MSTGSPGHQADSKCHHVLTAPKAVAVPIIRGEKSLEVPGLTPTLGRGTDSLPQPSPLCSVHIHSKYCNQMQMKLYQMHMEEPKPLISSDKSSCYKKYIP